MLSGTRKTDESERLPEILISLIPGQNYGKFVNAKNFARNPGNCQIT
jgi:hypothetical protein